MSDFLKDLGQNAVSEKDYRAAVDKEKKRCEDIFFDDLNRNIDDCVESFILELKEQIKKQATRGEFKEIDGKRVLTGSTFFECRDINPLSKRNGEEIKHGIVQNINGRTFICGEEEILYSVPTAHFTKIRQRPTGLEIFATILCGLLTCGFGVMLIWGRGKEDDCHKTVYVGTLQLSEQTKKVLKRLEKRAKEEGILLDECVVVHSELGFITPNIINSFNQEISFKVDRKHNHRDSRSIAENYGKKDTIKNVALRFTYHIVF